MKKTTIQMNGWFNTRCDLMAWDGVRKGFEVLSKGEGQVTAWWPKNLDRVKKEVLAFSWGANQAMMVMMWRIKSLLECLMEVTWYIWDYSRIWWMESSHVLKMAMLKWKDQYQHVGTLSWWRLEYTASVQNKDQLKRFKFVILLNLS